MIHPLAAQRLQLGSDRHELAVERFQRVVDRRGLAVGQRDPSGMARPAVHVIGDPLRPVRERGVQEISHLVTRRHSHGRRPRASLNDVQERHASLLRGLADHRQIEEVLIGVSRLGELVVVVADQGGLDHSEVLAEVFAIGGDRVPLRAKLLVARIGGEQVDVGQVRRITLAQVRHESAQAAEGRGAGLVRDGVAVQGRMLVDAGYQGVEFPSPFRVVQRPRREQRVAKLRAKAVSSGHVQFLLAAPDEIPAAIGHLSGDRVGQRRARPVGDDGRAYLPPRDSPSLRGGRREGQDAARECQHNRRPKQISPSTICHVFTLHWALRKPMAAAKAMPAGSNRLLDPLLTILPGSWDRASCFRRSPCLRRRTVAGSHRKRTDGRELGRVHSRYLSSHTSPARSHVRPPLPPRPRWPGQIASYFPRRGEAAWDRSLTSTTVAALTWTTSRWGFASILSR